MPKIYDTRAAMGSAIKSARSASGMLLTDVAKAVGVSEGFVSKIENGHALPSGAVALKLAETLGLDTDGIVASVTLLKESGLIKSSLREQFAAREGAAPRSEGADRPVADRGVQRQIGVLVRGEVVADPERQIEFFDGEDGPTITLGAAMDPPLSDGAYALRVSSRSMEPVIRPGQYVIADPALEPRDGDLCIVHMKNGARFFKRLRYNKIDPLQVQLQSQHGDYDAEDCLWSAIERCDVVRGAWYR